MGKYNFNNGQVDLFSIESLKSIFKYWKSYLSIENHILLQFIRVIT